MKLFSKPAAQAVAKVLAITLLCTLAGLCIGAVVAFRATQMKVNRYAQHLVDYADAYTREIGATLDQVNASPYPFCSDEDIARLRKIVFHGHLLKDIDRIRDGTVYCTSMSGRLSVPFKRDKPDIVARSGRAVWLNRPVLNVPGEIGDTTQSGEADFVATTDTFAHLREAPMTYTTTLVNRDQLLVVWTAGDSLDLTKNEVLAEKQVIRHGKMYATVCSKFFAPCIVTGIALTDGWELNRSLIRGFAVIGVLTGLALGITLVVLPGKRGLATQLRRALRRNLLTVVYQPIVEVKTGAIIGAEALARWTDEDGNYVPPDVFVAAAEELGFIGQLTRVVLRLIVGELGDFLRSNPTFHINVNIAATDLADPQFLPMLEKLLVKNGIASRSINLELTERSTANHRLAISAIGKLRERGHEFYIDDFGTGYSSLSYLNELAVDAIKIDRAFTDAVGTGSLTAAIVPQILAMAQALDVKVVVEGVERAEQSEYFAHLDQKILAQGWHFGEAVSAEKLLALIESKSAAAQDSVAN